jgi:ribosomal protein L11
MKPRKKKAEIIPVKLLAMKTEAFDFVLKTPPAAELLKKAAKGKRRLTR